MNRSEDTIQLHKLQKHLGGSVVTRPIAHDLRSAFDNAPYRTDVQHRHDYFEIYVLGHGGGLCQVDGESQEVDPSSIWILPPGVIHCWQQSSELDGFVARVPMQEGFKLPDASRQQSNLVSLDKSHTKHVMDLMSWIVDADSSALDGNDNLTQQRWRLLLDSIATDMANRNGKTPNRQSQCKQSRDVTSSSISTSFLTLLESNYRQRWNVRDYSRVLGTSRSSLLRATQAAFGQTPSELIQQRTLKEAERLLLHTASSCSEISYSLGFSNQADFTRAFTRWYNCSPSHCRKRRQSSA